MSTGRSCDVLVAGRGAAGCLAALRLAKAGLDVLLVGRDTTATGLSTGRIDATGVEGWTDVSAVLKELGSSHGLYQGPAGPRRAVTNQGTVNRQTMSSSCDWLLGEDHGPVAVAGLEGNQDLDPRAVGSALRATVPEVEVRTHFLPLDLPCPLNVVPSGRPRGREAAVDALAEALANVAEEVVVLPPLFLGAGAARALLDLERSSGRRVREAATPLSAPGRRLQACLEDGAEEAGTIVWNDRELSTLKINRTQAVEAIVRSGMREIPVTAKAVLLATGNLVAGGLVAEGDAVVDRLGLFATSRRDGDGIRSPGLREALSTGLATRDGRAVLRSGTTADNIFVAGSAAGLAYPLGRGLGHVMADAWAKAELIREAL